jgi:transposase InsO family protein
MGKIRERRAASTADTYAICLSNQHGSSGASAPNEAAAPSVRDRAGRLCTGLVHSRFVADRPGWVYCAVVLGTYSRRVVGPTRLRMMEAFYNPACRHSGLGYLSPVNYE